MGGDLLVRFYAELNDFVPPEMRRRDIRRRCGAHRSVKDLIESLGVPHTEVDLILVNGQPVDFGHQVQAGDRVSAYPVFESLDIGPVTRVRPVPLRDMRFVLDTHLGKLAAYLRIVGFDALYNNASSDRELAEISVREHRVLLTRDRGLLKRSEVTHGYCVRETTARNQLMEVTGRFDLAGQIRPFTRCARCNVLLEPVAREAIEDQLPEKVKNLFDEFRTCPCCKRIFWKGTHYDHMKRLIAEIRPDLA